MDTRVGSAPPQPALQTDPDRSQPAGGVSAAVVSPAAGADQVQRIARAGTNAGDQPQIRDFLAAHPEQNGPLQDAAFAAGNYSLFHQLNQSAEATPASSMAVTSPAGAPRTEPVASVQTPGVALQKLIDRDSDPRSFLQKTGDFAIGVLGGAARLTDAMRSDPGDALIGVGKGVGNLPTDIWNSLVSASKYQVDETGLTVPVGIEATRKNLEAMDAYRAGDIGKANRLADDAEQMMQFGHVPDPFTPTNDAQQGGTLASAVLPWGAVLKGVGIVGKIGKAEELLVGTAKATAQGATDALLAARFKEVLAATEAANPLVESLRATNQLPSNYLTKQNALAQGWAPGKALENFAPNGRLGGDVFQNDKNLLPSSSGRVWYEADTGIQAGAKRTSTRLLYSNDGLLYVSPDHYGNFFSIGKWK